jgi:hypothetical protein
VGVPFPEEKPNQLGGGDYLCWSRSIPLDTKATEKSPQGMISAFQRRHFIQNSPLPKERLLRMTLELHAAGRWASLF